MTYRFALILVLPLLLMACGDFETTVDIDLPEHEPVLVLGAIVVADSTWGIQVSESVGALDPVTDLAAEIIENATVEVYDGDERVDVLRYREGDFTSDYRGTHRPVPGRVYTVRASAPGFAPVTASAVLPMPVPVEIVSQEVVQDEFEQRLLEVQLAFDDPGDGAHFYQLSVDLADTFDGEVANVFRSFTFASSDPLLRETEPFDDVFEDDTEVFYDRALFRDVTFEGQKRRITIRIGTYDDGSGQSGYGQRFRVVLATVSEAYYRYETTLRAYERAGDNPFAEPVKVYTNVEGGLGIVAGYSEATAPLLNGYGF